ncbi:type VI secretion protein VasK [Cupriavidus necator]|uniref:Type VI secretion protein VasK n=1 Tax=Cupriavidus necator TaxID=106590 RepID=A0A1U9UMH9_CUPNE|nr:ImcF-related family protein [Cupriavidus necator]AQV93833.1 type VI secretion protein VasK [Cupriavidus necator]
MRKLQLDLVSILIAALLAMLAIYFWGDYGGINTPEERSWWLSVLAILALVLAVIASLDRFGRWMDAVRALGKWLHVRQTDMAGTTQGSIAESQSAAESASGSLKRLRRELRLELGWRYRERRPWLLLTGDDMAITGLLPALAFQSWLVTPNAVLLFARTGKDGHPDTARLKQLYKLRRRRPIDAVVLTINGDASLPTQRRGTHAYGMTLARITEILRWSAPVYVLDVSNADTTGNGNTPAIGCELQQDADGAAIDNALQALRNELAQRSVAQLIRNEADRYMAMLSQRLDTSAKPMAEWLAGLTNRQRWRFPVAGIVFAPYPAAAATDPETQPGADLPLWSYLADAARRGPGRRTGRHPMTVLSAIGLGSVALWTIGMVLSGILNSRDVHATQQSVTHLNAAPSAADRLRALLALQHQIERYEHRTQHRAPLATRFGLNRDEAVLDALWKPYAQASRRLLTTPVQQDLEASLVDLAQMQTTTLDEQTSKWALSGHQGLKAYLMLAEPERADAAFLTPQLVQHWSTEARITPGEQQDLAERLLGFYARHLKANPGWAIEPQPELVAGARQTLLAVIGQRNAGDTIYQGILTAFGDSNSKYPDQSLALLTSGTDPRGLVRAAATVPGVFTRQAYEGYIAPAIDQAAKRTEVASDWVLQGSAVTQHTETRSTEALQAALTEQYFADYAEHWQSFMNSLQWEPARTLPAAIGQLKLMADARQSPLMALMKALEYQGGAGARKDSLSDTLVAKAQDLLGKQAAGTESRKPDTAGPLGAAFGPVLRLVGQGQAGQSGKDDLSLQRFLDRATALRLRLQQVTNSADADAQARQMAQALFQGKGSELADTQAYAQLIAASLGSQWAGMGDTLFVRPIVQATQTVLQPAQASLNEAWRQSIAVAWGRSFAGRYPFADTANDASLPELARFLRPQGGLINAFLGTQLAGVLELQGDQWAPAATGGQTLAFDPVFLKAINILQRIAAHMLAQGEAQYRFEVRPIPTPGLTDTVLMLDGQKLHYYNQRETWQAMHWPAGNLQDLGTRLQWQSEQAGTNKNYEFGGRWGLVRMLERAQVEPLDSATYQLTWRGVPDTPESTASTGSSADSDADRLTARAAKLPAPAQMSYPIRYQVRTEVGQGPLEMLALRGFVLPTRIFTDERKQAVTGVAPGGRT